MLTVEERDSAGLVTLDDGKANAVGFEFVAALHDGLDWALEKAQAVVIAGRPGVFSAGFDLKVIRQGAAEAQPLRMQGARMMARLLLHPQPVVLACTGHAIAAGALILLCGDTRLGVAGDFKIGLNETAIGLVLSTFGTELAQFRIPAQHLTRSIIQADLCSPDEAVERAFIDEVVAADALIDTALQRAGSLIDLDAKAYGAVKRRLRAPTAQRMTAEFEIDLQAEGWLDE